MRNELQTSGGIARLRVPFWTPIARVSASRLRAKALGLRSRFGEGGSATARLLRVRDMVPGRWMGRAVFALLAAITTIGSMVCFFDSHDNGLKAVALAVLTVAFVLAVRCFED